MIIIADDTFDTEKFTFLKEEKYKEVCKIYKTIKTTDLADVKNEIERSTLFCCHKSLQIFSRDEKPLENNDNYKFREKLIGIAKEKVEFSGGIDDNNLESKKMRKDDFYKYLKSFLDSYIKTKTLNFELLFFGEQEQAQSGEILNKKTSFFEKNNFVFSDKESSFINSYSFAQTEEFSDKQLHTIVIENLNNQKYDNIFIPINFSQYSDFNGLRLATHIRCTSTKNQLTTIFIYGVPSLDRLMNNPYFDILKTKNVFYIGYNKKALQEAENKAVEVFSEDELSTELKKVNLEAPKDNHSIANEWAIYRWAKSVQADDYDIEKINQKIESNLYYKYLQTIYPVSESKDLQSIKVKFANERPRVLYIDDEYEKGWNEIFATILYDKSEKIDFESLETDFSASQERIIENAVQKIKEKDIDTVILDFRLHKNDFSNQNTNEITSVKLLQEIKRINAGIQVIFFSATNKIWNLQKLQEFGADGFIIKESPENSINPHFTQETICNFKVTMETAFKRRFLKELFSILDDLNQNVGNAKGSFSDEFDKFLNDLETQLKVIEIGLKNVDLKNKMSLDIVFLGCYNFMEKFKEFYFREDKKDYKYYIGVDNEDAKNYYFDRNNQFIEDKYIKELTWFCAMTNLFVDYFKICDKDDSTIRDLDKAKEKRNKYIHEGKLYFDEKELRLIFDLCKKITSELKE